MKTLHGIHGVYLAIAAIAFFRYWARTRFWLPRYVHVLAIGACALAYLLLSMAPDDAPIRQSAWGLVQQVGFLLLFPAIVYFFFVFYGGQHAAYEREHGRRVFCPYCGAPAHPTAAGPCPACGQEPGPR